jgi:predicted deacylase
MAVIDQSSNDRSERGAVAREALTVAHDAFGAEIVIPLIVLRGAKAGPTVAVDGACHGDEPEGPLAIFSLISSIDVSELAGTIVFAPTLNVPAVVAMQRGNPFDHWNGDLNRLFPGAAQGNLTQRIAHSYFENVASKADYVVSLHSGATFINWSPEVLANPDDEASFQLAKSLGPRWDVIRVSSRFPGSCAQACADVGITAISLEVGGAGDRVPASYADNIAAFADGLTNLLQSLEMLPGTPSAPDEWRLVEENALRFGQGGYLVIDPELPIRQPVSEGRVLGRLLGFYGDELEVIRAPFDGMVMGIRTVSYTPPGWPTFWFARIVGVESSAT